MNTVRTTARIEHSPLFAALRAFGTRNPLRRQRVIGGEGIGGRLETLAAFATGILLNRADRPSHTRRAAEAEAKARKYADQMEATRLENLAARIERSNPGAGRELARPFRIAARAYRTGFE